eukprot:69548_1
MTTEQFQNEFGKAKLYHASKHAKTLIPTGCSDEIYKQYEIKKEYMITINHLVAVTIYCNYSQLCYEFRKTFRKDESKETDQRNINLDTTSCNFQILLNMRRQAYLSFQQKGQESNDCFKQKHRNFYHLSKYLHEAVTVYSKLTAYGKDKIFYHGINEEMLFEQFGGAMNQPLSTTTSEQVAINFSEHKGLVLVLNANPMSAYFDCVWVSDFSNEKEKLFFFCPDGLHFINIINVTTGIRFDFGPCIKGLSMIEKCTNGIAFQESNEISSKMLNEWKMQKQFAVENYKPMYITQLRPTQYGAKEISNKLQILTKTMIEHQLSKFNKENATKYKRFNSLHGYVDNLLHNMCIKKNAVHINWHLMNIKVLNKYDKGYQGYYFLKKK